MGIFLFKTPGYKIGSYFQGTRRFEHGEKSDLSTSQRREAVLMLLRREEPMGVIARRSGSLSRRCRSGGTIPDRVAGFGGLRAWANLKKVFTPILKRH